MGKKERRRMYKVISGGQTGADQIGLRAALSSGLETGGWAPANYMTFKGPNKELGTLYNLVDCGGGYVLRTKMNVAIADLTLIYCDDEKSVGTKLTVKYCKELKSRYFINWFSFDEVVRYILSNNVKVINIAGNRDSKLQDLTKLKMEKFLTRVFTFLRRRELRRDYLEALQNIGQLQLDLPQ